MDLHFALVYRWHALFCGEARASALTDAFTAADGFQRRGKI